MLTVEKTSSKLAMAYRWKDALILRAFFLALFSLLLWAMIAVFASNIRAGAGLDAKLTLSGLIVIGIYLAYYLAAVWLNVTYIEVLKDRITVMTGPLPTIGGGKKDTRFDLANLNNLEVIVEHRQSGGLTPGGTTATSFAVIAVYPGKKEKLLSGLPDRFIAGQVLNHIKDFLTQ